MAEENPIIIPPPLHALEVNAPANAGPGWRRWFNKYTVTIFLIVAGIGIWQTIAVLLPYEENFCKTTVIVSNSGRADFTTISAAVEAMPPNLTRIRYCIKITAGVYNESVVIPFEKINLTLVGSGAEKTIISSDYTTKDSNATLFNRGNGLIALDLTIRRMVGPNDDGVALFNRGDFTVLYRCNIEGLQAVVSEKGNQFYRECQIQGGPYLTHGSGTTVFQKCKITATISSGQTEVGMVESERISPEFHNGFVFHQCQFSTNYGSETRAPTTYLIGADTEYSRVIVMMSFIDGSIEGWVLNDNSTSPRVVFAVFQNSGPGATNTPLSPLQTMESTAVASQFSVRKFLGGDAWIMHPSAPYDVDLDI